MAAMPCFRFNHSDKYLMKQLTFKTNIHSPIGIQAIWDALKEIGVTHFNIDFIDLNHAMKIASEHLISPQHIITVLKQLGYTCEYLNE